MALSLAPLERNCIYFQKLAQFGKPLPLACFTENQVILKRVSEALARIVKSNVPHRRPFTVFNPSRGASPQCFSWRARAQAGPFSKDEWS